MSLTSEERMDWFARTRRNHNGAVVLGVISLLLLLTTWMSYGLSPGYVFAAQTEEATSEDSADTSSDQKEDDTKDDDSAEDNEKTESEEKAEETKEKSDEEQPGDKDAEQEQERPIEEEPKREEARPSEKKPSKAEKKPPKKKKHIIGATATLMEKQSEILFRARVDSGAKSCSLHVENIKIENESETMADNIGKVIRFQVKNGKGKKHWLESKIASYVIIKTSNSRTRRYKVPLTFQWKHMEKKVLVTLNNRDSMEYPLLIGRNFLRGDFLVDVELDSDD